MKYLFALSAVLMLLVCPGCGGDTHESLMAENMTVMRDMVTTLETVKDAASAKAAKPKLTELAKKMNQLQERQSKLPMPSEADGKAMLAKYGKEMEELQTKMRSVQARIGIDPAIRAELDGIDMKAK